MGRIKAGKQNFKMWLNLSSGDELSLKNHTTDGTITSYCSCCCNCLQGNHAESQLIKMEEQQEDSPFIIVDLSPVRDTQSNLGWEKPKNSTGSTAPFKAGITSTLDQDAQSLVQTSKTKWKIPVLGKTRVLPFIDLVPFSQRQLTMNCSKAAKI